MIQINNGNRFLQWEEGDDWQTLATFLNNNSDDTYYREDLEKAFSSGGLGEGTIVDVTGAIPRFTNTRGGVDSSVSWDLVPFGGGARHAAKAGAKTGFFTRIARKLGFGGVKDSVRIPAAKATQNIIKSGSVTPLKRLHKTLDQNTLQHFRSESTEEIMES